MMTITADSRNVELYVEPQRGFPTAAASIYTPSRWMNLYQLICMPRKQLVCAQLSIYHNPLYGVESKHPLTWYTRVSLFEPPDKPYTYSVYDIATVQLYEWLRYYKKRWLRRTRTPVLFYRNHLDYWILSQQCIRGYHTYETDTERYYVVYLANGQHDRWVTETAVLSVPRYPEVLEAFDAFMNRTAQTHLLYETLPPITQVLQDLAST
jgi:hypothetical protein